MKKPYFVEGAQTRLEVGNDLFSNAKFIKRILLPATNTFDSYNKIVKSIIGLWEGELV